MGTKQQRNIRAMVKAGADVIEIGIPFSDPIAEGVVIQEASQHFTCRWYNTKGNLSDGKKN